MLEELHEFARSLDFSEVDFSLDGKIHRFDRDGKKNAWYIGWQIFSENNGVPFAVCVMGDWKTGEKHEFKPLQKLSRDETRQVKEKLKEAVKKSEDARKVKQAEAIAEATQLVASMTLDVSLSPYAVRKKIGAGSGAGLIDGTIIVPMKDISGTIQGAQRIYEDGQKYFITGQKTSGCFHVIGKIEDQIILVEGFATGTSVHAATGATVVVCFNCHNLLEVGKAFRKKYPAIGIVICGDDDRFTAGNPGRKYAEEAAEKIGAVCIFPTFKDKEKKNTDFNDLHCEEGLEEVKNQIIGLEKPEPTGYVPLGFDEGTYYFYTIKSKSIVKTSSFSDKSMLEIMPLQYWAECYPSAKGGVSWTQVKSDLIDACQKAGPFDVIRIRGTGVWRDQDRTVINTGDRLTVDGESMALSSIKSWYIYVQSRSRMPSIHHNPMIVSECDALRKVCESLTWNSPNHGILLAGWIAVARIAGALPVRPHVWLTGGSGTGKSTVMDRLVRPALGSEAARLYLQGGSTEAGVRQSVKANSMPIIFDEFETTNEASKVRVHAMIELLRQAWSETTGHIVKGSGDGTATHYALSFAALVSSIRVGLDNDADKSRFAVLELGKHGSDLQRWSQIVKMLSVIDEDYGERLFARMAGMIPTVLKSYRVAAPVIAKKINQRYGQQYGMLIAGWYALFSDEVLTEKTADSIVNDLELSGEKEQAEDTDELDAFTHLMTTQINIHVTSQTRANVTLGSVLAQLRSGKAEGDVDPGKALEEIRKYGIILEPNAVFVSTNHSETRKLFRGTRWGSNWGRSLDRLRGASKTRKRFDGPNQLHCIMVPID